MYDLQFLHRGIVSIHASSREDATIALLPTRTQHVSIHASSREDATRNSGNCNSAYWFQSTRPRGRTRQYENAMEPEPNVSIHASSREDATVIVAVYVTVTVSIHASSREDATKLVLAGNK